jgi:plasmid stability protein
MLPILKRCADGEEHPLALLRAQLAGDLGISPEDTKEKLPSGTQTRYENRIYWAAIYLHRAGCLERVRREVFKITERGQKTLGDQPEKITIKLLNQFPEFKVFHQGKAAVSATEVSAGPSPGAVTDDTQMPEETLENSYQALQNSQANEILESGTPGRRGSPTGGSSARFRGDMRPSGELPGTARTFAPNAGCHPLDMRRTCLYAEDMSKMIQVRDVPEQVHSTLKARAATEGMSLSDYIKQELKRTAERPTMREWLKSTRQAKPISTKRSAAQIMRELRDAQ